MPFWLRSSFVIFFAAAGLVMSHKIQRYIPFSVITGPAKNHQECGIRVMSFNVREFDLYSWSKDRKVRDKIVELVRKINPDVICMQDFYHSISKKYPFSTIDKFVSAGYRYYHIHYTHVVNDSNFWGIAIFSKYPLIRGHAFELDSIRGNAWIYSDVLLGRDTVRVINMHGASVKLKHLDYTYIENVLNKEAPQYRSWRKPGNEKLYEIARKVMRALYYRERQVKALLELVHKTSYPVLLCCDLNDIPNSYAYDQLTEYFRDAYISTGSGWGITYLGPLPFLRIDYILYSSSLKNQSFATLNYKLSDHKPLMACFTLEKIPD